MAGGGDDAMGAEAGPEEDRQPLLEAFSVQATHAIYDVTPPASLLLEEEATLVVPGRSGAKAARWKEVARLVGFGQLLSLLLCGCGVSSQALATYHNVSLPTTQSFLNYLALAAVCLPLLAQRAGIRATLRRHGLAYAFIALVDVEGNFLTVKAYQYSTLTSVQVLDCFAIVTVFVLSYFFLRHRYSRPTLLAIAVCMAGMALAITADSLHDQSQGAPPHTHTPLPFCLHARARARICSKEKVVHVIKCVCGVLCASNRPDARRYPGCSGIGLLWHLQRRRGRRGEGAEPRGVFGHAGPLWLCHQRCSDVRAVLLDCLLRLRGSRGREGGGRPMQRF